MDYLPSMAKNCTFYWTDQPLSYSSGPYERLNGFMFTLLGATPPVTNPDLTSQFFTQQNSINRSEVVVPLDYGSPDITYDPFHELCVESDWLFQTSSFYDCLAISAVSMRYQNDSVILRDENRKAVEERFRTGPIDELDWRTVIGDIYTCHNAVCASGQYGSCRSDFSLDGDLTQTLAEFTLELEHMCPDTMGMWSNLHVDDDVAGKGIVVANIIQVGLAIMFSVFANILGYFPALVSFFSAQRERRHGSEARRSSQRGTGPAKGGELARELQTSRPAVALFSTITEFQETQAYVLIAFQLATLVSYGSGWKPVDYFNVRTASFYVTVQAVPVLLIQSSLQRVGMRWWYMFCLTATVYALSVAVDQILLQYNRPTAIFDECRGAEYLLHGCVWDNMPDPIGRDAQVFARAAVKVSHLMMAFLLLDQLAHSTMLVRGVLARAIPKGARTRAESTLKHLVFRTILRLRWIVVDAFAYATIGYYLETVDLQLSRYFGRHKEWSYGSVIALVPWAPVSAKFLYMNILGVCDGVGRRIDPHYHVVPNIAEEEASATRGRLGSTFRMQSNFGSIRNPQDKQPNPEYASTLNASPSTSPPSGVSSVSVDVEQGLSPNSSTQAYKDDSRT